MKRFKKFFAISMILLIVSLIGTSVYAVQKSITEEDLQNTKTEIMTEVENVKNEQASMQNIQNELVEKLNETTNENKTNGIGLIAAALATGLGCIGAGIAVAVVASSAVGAVSENPSLLGKTIIFAGLAEGIAIYGLIISIMILSKI